MTTLSQQQCTPCHSDADALTAAQIRPLLSQIPRWQLAEDEGIYRLQRRYDFNNFIQAVAFTNRIAELAEQYDHHPSLLTEWGRVTVTWWTHSIDGLHQNDFIMAAKTDRAYD